MIVHRIAFRLMEENGPPRSFGSAWFSLAILIIVRQNNFTPTFLVCYTFLNERSPLNC